MRRLCFALFLLGCGSTRHEADHTEMARDETVRDEGTDAERLAQVREVLDVGCDECHREIADEWRRTLHARADADPVYRVERDLAPSPFCNRCHAPLANETAPRAGAARAVGCVLCHVPHATDQETERDVARRVDTPATRRCAACHDFPFDAEHSESAYAPGQQLQRTAREWRASAARTEGKTCVTCHFPQVASSDGGMHASHALPAAHDEAMLASSLSTNVVATREHDGVRVAVTLVSRAGHAVPTGDLYRTLLVRVEDADHPTERDGRARDDLAALRRHFETSAAGLVEVLDDRVPADGTPRVVILSLPRDTARVRWELRWLALDPTLAEQRGLARDDVRRDFASGVVQVDGDVTPLR